MFTLRHVLTSGNSQGSRTVFNATNAGRIYAASVNILAGIAKVLDVVGGHIPSGFYQIDNLTVDGGNTNVTLLENVDSGNGLTHVRFTNMQFAHNSGAAPAKINIDRTKVGGGSTGQTVVEIVGSRGLTLGDTRLTDNVTIKGASSSKPSRVIVRDSELDEDDRLIKPTGEGGTSEFYSENRLYNWLFNEGLQTNT